MIEIYAQDLCIGVELTFNIHHVKKRDLCIRIASFTNQMFSYKKFLIKKFKGNSIILNACNNLVIL